MAALFDKGNLLTGTQPVDSALSSTSEFPLQNKVIKQNFDSITTTLGGKVNTSDIKNNLTSTDTDKPLSAYQGKVLDDKITTVSVNLTNKLKHYVHTYNATFTAGSNGYFSVPISTDIKDSNLVSIWVYCAHVSTTSGLQLTPIAISSGTLYVHYYSPRAFTNEDIQFHIITCDNMPYATSS